MHFIQKWGKRDGRRWQLASSKINMRNILHVWKIYTRSLKMHVDLNFNNSNWQKMHLIRVSIKLHVHIFCSCSKVLIIIFIKIQITMMTTSRVLQYPWKGVKEMEICNVIITIFIGLLSKSWSFKRTATILHFPKEWVNIYEGKWWY